MSFRHLAVISFVVLGATFSGCGSGDGGVCQIDGDCAAGLVCTCKQGGAVGARGVCRSVATPLCTSGGGDTGVSPDAAMSVDAATTVDTGVDTGVDVGVDAGVDANATVDANVDANVDAATVDSATDANASPG